MKASIAIAAIRLHFGFHYDGQEPCRGDWRSTQLQNSLLNIGTINNAMGRYLTAVDEMEIMEKGVAPRHILLFDAQMVDFPRINIVFIVNRTRR